MGASDPPVFSLDQLVTLFQGVCSSELIQSFLHGLNNHVQIVSGYSQLLSLGELPQNVRDSLTKIQSELERCRAIAQGLSHFASRAGRKAALHDIDAIVQGILTINMSSFRQRRITVLRGGAEGPQIAELIARNFSIVLQSLLSCAMRRLAQKDGNRVIELRIEREGEGLDLVIEDNGLDEAETAQDTSMGPTADPSILDLIGMGEQAAEEICRRCGWTFEREVPSSGEGRIVRVGLRAPAQNDRVVS